MREKSKTRVSLVKEMSPAILLRRELAVEIGDGFDWFDMHTAFQQPRPDDVCDALPIFYHGFMATKDYNCSDYRCTR